MNHSRLRRSFRRAVDFLTLRLAGLFTGHRFLASGLKRSENEIGATPVAGTDDGLLGRCPPKVSRSGLPRFVSPRRSISLSWVRVRHRRYLASSMLLLACSLEVCGCNPMPKSEVLAPFVQGRDVLPIVPVEQHLSFYDPADPSVDRVGAPLRVGELLIETRPAPVDVKALPWAIPESVYLLYKGRHPSGHRAEQPPIATAFVLSVPDQAHSRLLRFLVTARHVVDPEWAHCSEQNPESISVRLNRRSGGVGYETVSLESGKTRRFLTPSDATADLAIIPLDRSVIANLDEYKFIDVPFRLLPTASELHLVRIEQPVMTAALSSQPSGALGTYPIFDAGFVSNMPVEAIDVQCGSAQLPAKPLHVWFIDAGAPQGASGAPVYTAVERGKGAGKSPVLLGIQSVAWPDKGIAGITPASVLGDVVQLALRNRGPNMVSSRGSKR